jgi:hypothetical protein
MKYKILVKYPNSNDFLELKQIEVTNRLRVASMLMRILENLETGFWTCVQVEVG